MKTGLPNNHKPPVGVGEKPTKDAALQIDPPVLFALVGRYAMPCACSPFTRRLKRGKTLATDYGQRRLLAIYPRFTTFAHAKS